MLAKALVLVFLFCTISTLGSELTDADFYELFENFVVQYNKTYSSDDHYLQRFEVFKKNLIMIEEYNLLNTGVKLAMNQFGDLTHEEYFSMLSSPVTAFPVYEAGDDYEVAAPPASVDWRSKNIVTPVRNQAQCGPGICFSIVDSLSAFYSIKAKDVPYVFDTTVLTQCDGKGCNSQTADAVWAYIQKRGLGWYFDGVCPNEPIVGLCIKGSNYTKSGSESDLQIAVANKGPVAASIDASRSSFQFYASGVYYESSCSSTSLNHALLIVGYGTSNGQDYWLCKNSWGTSWGQSGYIMMARNRSNNCGIASQASYGTGIGNCVCEN
jgi:cathepsin L